MFGRLLGEILAMPLRIASVPYRVAQKAAEAADDFMLPGGGSLNYRAPRRNVIDKAADAVSNATSEALGDE